MAIIEDRDFSFELEDSISATVEVPAYAGALTVAAEKSETNESEILKPDTTEDAALAKSANKAPHQQEAANSQSLTGSPPVREVFIRTKKGIDIVKRYMDEAGRIPRLDKAGEQQLGRIIFNGREVRAKLKADGELTPDEKQALKDAETATIKFFLANLLLVVSVAKTRSYQDIGLTRLELIQNGNLGLMKAVGKFDYRKGFKFSTYAVKWVRQSINLGIDKESRNIRLPTYVREARSGIEVTQAALAQDLGRIPTIAEIADFQGMEPDEVRTLLGLESTLSLDEPLTPDSNRDLADVTPDHTMVSPEEYSESHELRSKLAKALGSLPVDVRQAVWLRYPLDGSPPMTYEEIAGHLGVPVKSVPTLLKKGMIKLRTTEHGLRGLLYDD